MSSTAEQKAPPVNRAGLTVKDYGGLKSTLCVGCGHDVITRQITQAFYDMGVAPYKAAKMSGIGCSSKTTAYFADRGHGFNAVHGRMPAVATGAVLANQTLLAIGISGAVTLVGGLIWYFVQPKTTDSKRGRIGGPLFTF